MTRHVPPSIDSFGGISPYLDKTKDEHRGYGSADLIQNWNWGQGKHLSISALAVMFGVVRLTMADWLKRLHTEAGKPWPPKKANGHA